MSNNNTSHSNYNNRKHNSVHVDTVVVDRTVTKLVDGAFDQCSSLKTIILPDLVTSIGNCAFIGCTSLATIAIPALVTIIGEGAFSDCTALSEINIPNRVTSIGACAFWGCTSLATINIPNQVTTIEEGTFRGCTSLATITIPDLVTSIGQYAFSECTSLVSIIIPDQVSTIGSRAFYGCTSLATINLPDQVTSIGVGTFCDCTSLTTISIPDQVTEIECYAFRDCTSLATVNIPNLVTTIGEGAFLGCISLAVINIPNQDSTIESCAFDDCTALEKREATGNNSHDNNTIAWLRERFNNLPLHQACYNNNTNTLTTDTSNLNSLIQQDSAASKLPPTDAMLMTPLHVICCNPTASIESIQMVKAAKPKAASMRNVLHKTPLMMLLESKSEQYSQFCDKNEELLPLVGLLEEGLDFDALEMIKSASDNDILFVSELEIEDETSGLLPFMYAASLENCRLDVVYELLTMKLPNLLLSKTSNKRKRNSSQ